MSAILENAELAPGEAKLHLFTRKEYHALCDSRVFGPEHERKLELIKGRIVKMMSLGPWHIGTSNLLNDLLTEAYRKRAVVSADNPVGLGNDSEPQPDFTILRWRDDRYKSAIPEAADVILLIEVADTSRAYDLGTKHDLYAESGIKEVWVVDRQLQAIHTFRNPQNGLFLESRVCRAGEVLALPDSGGASIKVEEITS
jgi:Uma2 family endonuclease